MFIAFHVEITITMGTSDKIIEMERESIKTYNANQRSLIIRLSVRALTKSLRRRTLNKSLRRSLNNSLKCRGLNNWLSCRSRRYP